MSCEKARVGYLTHKIDQDKLRPGDHIYIHEYGGLTNKHGIVVHLKGELKVVHQCRRSGKVVSNSLDEFRKGKSIRLALYDLKRREVFKRKGTSFREHRKSSKEVEQSALWVLDNASDYASEGMHSRNISESFALSCSTMSFVTVTKKPAKTRKDDKTIKIGKTPKYDNDSHCTSVSSSLSIDLASQDFPLTDDSNDRVKYYSHKIDRNDLQPGDHIYAYRKSGVYHHHGIYLGINSQGEHIVSHFSGDRELNSFKAKSTAKVRISTLDQFLNGEKLRLVSYNDPSASKRKRLGTIHMGPCLPAVRVAETAKYYADNPEIWKCYKLLTNNCEMFALYCKTGLKSQNPCYLDQTQSRFLQLLPQRKHTSDDMCCH